LGPGRCAIPAFRLLGRGDSTENQSQAWHLAGGFHMATKVAINGFGRIGRNVARAILERTDHDLELVSINDLADAKANARLFKHDSVHGAFPGTVETDGNDLVINGKRIHVTAERDPA